MRLQVHAGILTIYEPGSVIDPSGDPRPARQSEVEVAVERMPLIVVKEKITRFWRRKVRQSACDRTLSLGVLIRIRDVDFTAMEQPRGTDRKLPSRNTRARNRQRKEHVRITDGVMVEVVGCPLTETVDIGTPSSKGN